MTKHRTITFKDKKGMAYEFKTPSGPIITAIILAKYPKDSALGVTLKDGRQAVTVAKGLDAERIARNHTVHYQAKELEIVKEWKEI